MAVHVFTYNRNANQFAMGAAGPNVGPAEDVTIFRNADTFEILSRGDYIAGVLILQGERKVGFVSNPLRILVEDEPELEGDAG